MPALALAVLTLATVAPAVAVARESAFDQYVPSLPGAGGGQVPRLGGPTAPAALAPDARARLLRQPDGALLLRIATARGLGAPPPARARRRGPGGGAGDAGAASAADGSALAAVRGAVREPAVLALLGGMLASGCALLGLALAQRRRA